jgi:hypothetical protein
MLVNFSFSIQFMFVFSYLLVHGLIFMQEVNGSGRERNMKGAKCIAIANTATR